MLLLVNSSKFALSSSQFDDMPVRMSSTHIPSEDLEAPIKQGIVTILGADCDKTTKPGSLRRTLSADMSSRKWLQQNGFINKTAVSPSSSSSSETSEEDFDEVWRSIQAQKPPQTTGVWTSLIHSQKSDSSMLPPLPYAPPPMKRSASSLSDKSLQICTESLGSETGSDGFSCYGDEDMIENNNTNFKQRSEGEVVRGDDPLAHDLHVPKYKKSPPRPFPPPLPSIAGGDGASLHMQSHRENGRLVVEAVSVAPRKYFHAQRRDGRLRLTLVHGPSILQVEEEEKLEVFDDMEAVGEDGGGGHGNEAVEEIDGAKEEFVEEQNLSLPTGMISVHKSGLVMKKLMAAGNINPKWSKKINDEMVTGEEELPITQSLPPRPPVARLITPSPPAAAASFNAYEYFWRTKPAVSGGFISPMVSSRNKINQDLVVMKAGKTEQFEPYMRGCKEARRSLIWEPYCIATS